MFFPPVLGVLELLESFLGLETSRAQKAPASLSVKAHVAPQRSSSGAKKKTYSKVSSSWLASPFPSSLAEV